ncbi:ABC transporter ATP-binding protein [Brevundimonas sp. PAMC22021]|uniref:ABC transporter ATP-binding protein n=1 Tax=Brevundimonas sp. PAMC22021 TaxID=2861285 RepID=UPI001C630A22|nr:ABC transporter ATP-binding protein [Brevundimonas sp. PAMC22021]QYF87000.1 ABC transporter ATP-binding protein [Brevundimonas sp. PAMC22021]
MADLAIETLRLTRRFGDRSVVDAVSLSAPRGSIYGFLGRNGAGKTTTIRMLLGLLKPTSGAAVIGGVDVGADRIAAARKVGSLLEAHGFYANLTGRENLSLTCTLRGFARSEIDRVLDVVEMRRDANRRVSDYSLGMRQRIGLARALLGAPAVLILDEPTNGLDPEGIADMRRLLRGLPDAAGATVLVSSHLLSEIEQVATHVGILSQGRLVLEDALTRLKAEQAPELELRIDDPQRAAGVLRDRDLSVSMRDAALTVRLRPGHDHDAACAALNVALVEAGVGVFSLGARPPSLEGIYECVSRSNETAMPPQNEAAR